METNIYNKEPELSQCHLLSDFMTLLREPKDVPHLTRRKKTNVPSVNGLMGLCFSVLEFPRTDTISAASVRDKLTWRPKGALSRPSPFQGGFAWESPTGLQPYLHLGCPLLIQSQELLNQCFFKDT